VSEKKYYVVWEGTKTGIFGSWEECKKYVIGIKGAKYKSFKSREAAKRAFEKSYEEFKQKKPIMELLRQDDSIKKMPVSASISVDAACSGNPGALEYRGVWTETETELFHKKHSIGTNNIGEFLAIVFALAYAKKHNIEAPIYSDSAIAIKWVKTKKCRTKLNKNSKTKKIFKVIDKAEKWLKDNKYENKILKWDTKIWGEIPADFGRK